MSLAFSHKNTVSLTRQATADEITQQAVVSVVHSFALTDGTAAGQCDREFKDSRTLAASASESLDLVGGTLTNTLGTTISFAKLKFIRVVAASTNVGAIRVARHASTGVPFMVAVSDAVDLVPNAAFTLENATGWTCTAATADLITISNQDGTNAGTYDIVLVGTSA